MKKIVIQALLLCTVAFSSLNLMGSYTGSMTTQEPMIMNEMPGMPNEPIVTTYNDKGNTGMGKKTYKNKKNRKKPISKREPLGKRIENLENRVTRLEEVTGTMTSM